MQLVTRSSAMRRSRIIILLVASALLAVAVPVAIRINKVQAPSRLSATSPTRFGLSTQDALRMYRENLFGDSN